MGYYVFGAGYYQLMLLEDNMFSFHKWYAKNGSHKLTACYKVYYTYKLSKNNIFKKNQVYTGYCC